MWCKVVQLMMVAGMGSSVFGQENRYIGPTGPPFNLWGRPDNWSLNDPPGSTHDVTVTTPNATIQMDYNPPQSYSILSFRPSVAGTLQMTGFNDMNWLTGARNDGLFNAYTINVQSGQQVTSGSPFGQTGWTNTTVERFRWIADGGSRIGVVGTIGPGNWSLGSGTYPRANLDVGFVVGEGGLMISDPAARGTIDSGITSAYGPSGWTLNGVFVRAKRCQNLDIWNVTQAEDGARNQIHAVEYFQTGQTILSGRSDTELLVATSSATADPGGLRVKDLLEAKAPLGRFDAPTIETEKLEVDSGKTIRLAHGAHLRVKESSIPEINHSAFAPVSVAFHGTSTMGSKLLYGPRASNAMRMTEFEVQEFADREPAIQFLGQSYIGTQMDPDTSPTQEMLIRLDVHFDIQVETMRLPGIAWHTGGTDILVYPSDTAAAIENIAADCCNVFFTDVQEPRCLKYWRNVSLKEDPFIFVQARLADKHENYLPNLGNQLPEAMYIKDRLSGLDDFYRTIDLNQNRLYYGDLIGDPAGLFNGVHARLIKTRFGDFDGNCRIDSADYYDFLRPFVTSPGVVTAYPLGDSDGDCDIDLVDLTEYRRRVGLTNTCTTLPPIPALSCPAGVPPGSSPGAGAEAHEGDAGVDGTYLFTV